MEAAQKAKAAEDEIERKRKLALEDEGQQNTKLAEDGVTIPKVPEGEGEKRTEPEATATSTGDAGNADCKGLLTRGDVSVGMEVLTVFGKHKWKYDNKRATITIVNEKSVQACILEGSAKDEHVTLKYHQIRAVLAASIVPPAGGKKQSVEAALSQDEKRPKVEPDGKALSGTAKAMQIFAKAGVDSQDD